MMTLTSLTITGNKAALLAINDIIEYDKDFIVNFLCDTYGAKRKAAQEMAQSLEVKADFRESE